MKTRTKIITSLVLLTMLLLPAGSAQAKGLIDGPVIFGDDFTLESGETLEGDLVVIGGDVTIEEDARVTGSIVVIGGIVTQDGEVERDIVILGGQIDLGDGALVNGDVVTIGGQVNQAAGAVIAGEVIENVPAPSIQIPDAPRPPYAPRAPRLPQVRDFYVQFSPLAEAMSVIFNALAVAALAMLLSVFLQPQIERVGRTIVRQPLASGSIGLLTVVLLPFALLVMIVTILLIPVAFLAVLALMLAWLFGIVAIGQEIGERLSRSMNQSWTPVLSVGLGTFLLMFVGGVVGMVPCIGPLVPIVVGFMALGGVVMTWMGARRAGRPVAIDPTEPVPPAS